MGNCKMTPQAAGSTSWMMPANWSSIGMNPCKRVPQNGLTHNWPLNFAIKNLGWIHQTKTYCVYIYTYVYIYIYYILYIYYICIYYIYVYMCDLQEMIWSIISINLVVRFPCKCPISTPQARGRKLATKAGGTWLISRKKYAIICHGQEQPCSLEVFKMGDGNWTFAISRWVGDRKRDLTVPGARKRSPEELKSLKTGGELSEEAYYN